MGKKVLPSITAYVSKVWRRGRDGVVDEKCLWFFFCFPLYCPGELKCAYPFTSHSRAKYRTLSAIYCPQHATG